CSTELAQDEIDWLSAIFASQRMADDAVTIEQVDGYFCALAMDPDRDRAREATLAILGMPQKASAFESQEPAEQAARLVTRMWNRISERLAAGYPHQPILWSSEAPKAQAWAKGFMTGMQASRSTWWNAIKSQDTRMFLLPILGLALNEGEEEEGI